MKQTNAISRQVLLGRRQFLIALSAAVGAMAVAAPASAEDDPLPSWGDGKSKAALIDFVRRTTEAGGASFVEPERRLATFDNDGTLWAEQPFYFQVLFALDELKRLAAARPELLDKEPFKSATAEGLKWLGEAGEKGVVELIGATHAGMTTEEFDKSVADWLATARHPTKHRPYLDLVYQPQIELLAYLRAHGFKTFIVSGGGVEFMRVFSERAYGIARDQVVGSYGGLEFRVTESGSGELLKLPKIDFVDDGPGKAVGIARFIGRRPILAFGNSDGDRQMLEYATTGPGPTLGLLLHHTDAEREWAYDRDSKVGKLDKALDEAPSRGWIVVDMKTDWRTVFPPYK